MITFLEGIVEEKQPTRVVLNVGGVGYEVIVTLNTFEDLPPTRAKVRIHTHHHVREDTEVLYGFTDTSERDFFVTLIAVSGIGPVLAISILSGLPLVSLRAAIASEDVKRLSSIKGVGKKTAERIIVELRDKVSALAVAEERTKAGAASPEQKALNDAVLALVALGYRNAEAYAAVKRVLADADELPPVEDVVRRSLASL